jgi:hypothetical protein
VEVDIDAWLASRSAGDSVDCRHGAMRSYARSQARPGLAERTSDRCSSDSS